MPLSLVSVAVVLLSAFVKGAIGFGFPTLATPLLTLVLDVKTSFVLLIVPNIVMDGIQFARRGASLATVRRMATLIIAGALGTVLGTRLLVALPSRTVMGVLGGFIVVFVGLSVARVTLRVPEAAEWWASPVAGLLAGLVGGITNVPGTPLVMYFYALGMDKHEFVRSVALSFVVYKLVQLGAVTYYGLLTWRLTAMSVTLTLVALVGFWLGLAVQDRLEQRTFNRVVLGFLAGLGAWLVIRASV
jgi:uncharacterized membrane protein YfcA